MRYSQGGGLTAERQAFRERVRMEAVAMFADGRGQYGDREGVTSQCPVGQGVASGLAGGRSGRGSFPWPGIQAEVERRAVGP